MRFLHCFTKNRKKTVKAIEVYLEQGYFHVRPSCGTFEMIHRAAKGVYWESNTQSLYFKGEASRENALRIIDEALQEEYGITLEMND